MQAEHKKTILLVEDQAVISIAEAKILKNNSFKVLTAINGNEAISISNKNKLIDLILMDVDLGKGIDGTEAAQIILQEREIPIVFLSNHTEKELVEKTEKITSYGYVLKDAGETVLIASIKMAFKLFEANQKIKNELAERKAAEEALRASEEKFKKIVEDTNALLFNVDKNGRVTYINETVALTVGYSREEMIGRFYLKFVYPEDRKRVHGVFVQQLNGLIQNSVFEFRYIKKDGTFGWLSFLTNQIYQNKQIVGLNGVAQDITIRKRIENELRENEERYRSIVENLNQAYYEADRRGVFTYCNPGLILISGYSEKELLGTISFNLVAKEYRKEIVASYKSAINQKETDITTEFKVQTKNGKKFWVEQATHFEFDARGNFINATNIIRNIDERKQAEEIIKESEANLNIMINNRKESIWSIDKDYNYLILNNFFKEAYLTVFGIELEIGMNALGILPPVVKEFWKPKYDKALAGEKVVFEITNLFENELHHYEVSLDSIVSDGNVIGISGLSVDVTARKQAEQILKNSAEEKEALHRELLHRVKNSFSQIKSILYFERERLKDTKANRVLENLEMRIGTLSEMYSLLNASGVSELINLGKYLEQITKSLKESYLENEVKIKIETDIEVINTTPKIASSVGLVINELLTNSLKYAFPKNKKGTIFIGLKGLDGNAEVEIADNGIGLPDDFSIEQSKGLGLQLVNLLVNQLDGKLTYVAKNGTKFKIVFPVND